MRYEPGADWETVEKVMLRQRAIREFTDAPVDDAMLERCIRAATFAPSGGNTQPWRFIVIRDRETKRKLGVIFDELGVQFYGANAPVRTPWEDVPVLIACITERGQGHRRRLDLPGRAEPAARHPCQRPRLRPDDAMEGAPGGGQRPCSACRRAWSRTPSCRWAGPTAATAAASACPWRRSLIGSSTASPGKARSLK